MLKNVYFIFEFILLPFQAIFSADGTDGKTGFQIELFSFTFEFGFYVQFTTEIILIRRWNILYIFCRME